MADLSTVMSPASLKRLEMLISNRTVPARQAITLLKIWSEDKPKVMKRLDQANSLLPLLTSYAPALNKAADLAGENSHLASHEILELAGLPLRLPA